MNKKGIFSPTLLVILLIVMGYSYYVLVINEVKDIELTKGIGWVQSEIIDVYQEAEKISFYIDQSAKQSVYNAIYDLGENGGFFGVGCGKTKEGYIIWRSKGKAKCYPFEFKRDFTFYFKNNLNNLFKFYQERKFLEDNYDTVLKEGKIVGSAKTHFNLTKSKIIDDVTSDYITYSFDPSFEVFLNYNFSDYETIKNKMDALIPMCYNRDCFNSRIEAINDGTLILKDVKKDNFVWNIRDEGNFVLFDVDTKNKVFHKPVKIRFALEYTKQQ